jgi:hypothetical protein
VKSTLRDIEDKGIKALKLSFIPRCATLLVVTIMFISKSPLSYFVV